MWLDEVSTPVDLTEIPCTGHHCLRSLTGFATLQPDLTRLVQAHLLYFHRVLLISGYKIKVLFCTVRQSICLPSYSKRIVGPIISKAESHVE
jgi:hypothetical protein